MFVSNACGDDGWYVGYTGFDWNLFFKEYLTPEKEQRICNSDGGTDTFLCH